MGRKTTTNTYDNDTGSLATILAGFGGGPLGPVCAGIIAAEVTGIQGGTMAQAFKAFALTTFEGEAFKTTQLQASWSTAERALAAGMIGGIVSVAGGGKFAGGFLAAGLSTIAAPSVEQINSRIGGTLASAVLGGVGSVLGGGKFANGAVTGAFAYMAEATGGSDAYDTKSQGIPSSANWPSMLKQTDMTQINQAIADAVVYYNIDTSGVQGFRYAPNLSDEAETTNSGIVILGPKAFSSFGYLGSTLSHEIEIHIHLQLQNGLWWIDQQGKAMQEVQAYDYQLSQEEKTRFGLSPGEVKQLMQYRSLWFNQLNSWNQIHANAGNFSSYVK